MASDRTSLPFVLASGESPSVLGLTHQSTPTRGMEGLCTDMRRSALVLEQKRMRNVREVKHLDQGEAVLPETSHFQDERPNCLSHTDPGSYT